MGITVKLQAFEGPLDLLLHLIDKNKVNIYDIPIVEITNQYMDYIRQMQKRDLNIMSEFLVMAATLLEIKSKMLLPAKINDAGEEEDPREELVQKLLEYKVYKYMAYELKDKQIEAQRTMYKPSTVPKEVLEYEPPVNIQDLLSDVSITRLHMIFKTIIKKQEEKVDPIRSKFGKIEKEEVSLSDKIGYLEEFIQKKRRFNFRELFSEHKTKMQIIVTFLAVLELMKTGKITIMQKEVFDDILICAADEGV